MAMGVLKLIAKATPWAVDDQIVQIKYGLITNIERKPFPILKAPEAKPVSKKEDIPPKHYKAKITIKYGEEF